MKLKNFLIQCGTLHTHLKDVEGNGISGTIGYGRRVYKFINGKPNPEYESFKQYTKVNPIPHELAEKMLETDIPIHGQLQTLQSGYKRKIPICVPLYQREVDALIDMNFNGGAVWGHVGRSISKLNHDRVEGYSVEELLNGGNYSNAAIVMPERYNTSEGFKWSRGVVRRRRAEQGIFLTANYDWSSYAGPSR